jgi:hypothetical protein
MFHHRQKHRVHHHHQNHSHSSFPTRLVGKRTTSPVVVQGQTVVRKRSPILPFLAGSFVAVLKFIVRVIYISVKKPDPIYANLTQLNLA